MYLLRLLFFSLYCTLVLGHNTFRPHANRQTLLQSALLALAAHIHVDLAVVAVLALIHCVPGDASSEEALATFTRKGIIMITRRTIATYKAQFLLLSRRGSFSLLRVASFITTTSNPAASASVATPVTTATTTAAATTPGIISIAIY